MNINIRNITNCISGIYRHTGRVAALMVPALLLLVAVSCNSKNDDPDNTGYTVSTDAAVTNFKLKADAKILRGLDSVFFSIDLQQGLIYNADSLPKGTPVAKLVPVISFPASASSVTINMTGGKYREGTVDYKKNPTDSIDFTGRVVLTVVAQDGKTTREYLMKVNVHEMQPDSLWWDEMAVAKLPSRLADSPINQRTIGVDNKAVTLLQESDGTYTISESEDIANAQWNKQRVEFGFVPDLRSMTASAGKLFILSNDGDLYSSEDGTEWLSVGVAGWQSIIGDFSGRLLGLRANQGNYSFAEYPQGGIDGQAVPADFPVTGRTDFYTFSNKWSAEPTGILVGGYTADGANTGCTWGFDGTQWANISAHPAGQVAEATLIPYFIYRKTSTLWVHTEYSVWLLVGGKKADGSMNRETYLSYDNGVNWYIAPELLRLPDYIPAMCNADNVVLDTPMQGSFRPDGWNKMPQRDLASWYRVQYNVDGYNVEWNCPYIYLFGGMDSNGQLCDNIWKGVLNRLTFVPLM